MYGETVGLPAVAGEDTGLSPHVRGNRNEALDIPAATGSIPACTGKPSTVAGRGARGRVYPRMYGETRAASRAPVRKKGLSPHVRGNHRTTRRRSAISRSIPACTGKPARCRRRRSTRWVYPRMYGETEVMRARRSSWLGLSPHVRGNQDHQRLEAACSRSIPACTGKPSSHRRLPPRLMVYPRMYGETRTAGAGAGAAEGLSPHVRGNLRAHPRRR